MSSDNIIGSINDKRHLRRKALKSTSKVLLASDPPSNYRSIEHRSDAAEWYGAADAEWDGLCARDFGTLVARPASVQVLDTMWVFDRKASGLAKGRMVVRGDQQHLIRSLKSKRLTLQLLRMVLLKFSVLLLRVKVC